MAKKSPNILYKQESYDIVGCCFDLYKELGNGHKEVIYQRGLVEKLKGKDFEVSREKRIPIFVNNKKVGMYVPDIVVNNIIMLELKAKSQLIKADIQQFWQYLKCTEYKLGLLVNFGKPGKVEIVRRVYDTARSD